jgi:hypothetical protein
MSEFYFIPLAISLVLIYAAVVMTIGNKIQDWAMKNGRGPVLWPWLFVMFMFFVIPPLIRITIAGYQGVLVR